MIMDQIKSIMDQIKSMLNCKQFHVKGVGVQVDIKDEMPLVNKSLSVDVQNIQVIKNEGNSNSQKTLYSIHYPMLYQDLIRYNSNKVLGPFLENLTEVEKYKYPPPLKITVHLSCETKLPKQLKAILKWDFKNDVRDSQINIISYEVIAIAVYNNKIIMNNGWVKIIKVKSLPLPMTCTCQLVTVNGAIYYFAIRAIGMDGKCGPFSISLPLEIRY
ncbi:uncharacterized protein LOC112689975 [Sipha flava]|uniref:Uncharacterized protein LOC112689975 n=2 Tax=Sipha flava TaxID=143950 RepID=A0A8B8GA21_9HEMI|nr:uncharacterized protein LOC112689975 [Sipha flava]